MSVAEEPRRPLPAARGGSRLPAVALLDAMGTLLTLEPPGPLLAAELAAAGAPIEAQEAERAFRVEIDYYRAHHLEGVDEESLSALRDRCATAMHTALPAHARAQVPIASLREAMLASLRFEAVPCAIETLRTLRAMGLRLIVVSNWDVSLPEALQLTRLMPYLDGVVTSAEVGVAKPGRAIFEHALKLAGAAPSDAVHVGDSPQLDVAGARKAGIQPILLGAASSPAAPSIASLAQLPGIVESLGGR